MGRTERAGRGAVLVILAGVVIYAGWKAFWGALHGPQCGTENPGQGLLTTGAGVVAFVLGRAFASYRAWREAPAEPARPTRTAKVVQGMVALFFGVVVLVLAYETVGLLGWGGLEPITSYVRCARTHDAGWTAAAACVVSFLAGHWLWFPVPKPGPGGEVPA